MATSKWSRFYRRIVLILVCSLFAKSGTSQENQIVLRNFDCGLVDLLDAAEINDGCAQSIQNVDVWSGKVEKRRGSFVINSSTPIASGSNIKLIHEFTDTSNTTHVLIIDTTTLLGSTDNAQSFTQLSNDLGWTSTSRFSAINAFGNAYLTDGTTHFVQYDGSSLSRPTEIPLGSETEFYAERLWSGGVDATPSVLFGSRFQDVTDWTATDTDAGEAISFFVNQNDGTQIRALKKFRGNLYIFKDKSLHVLSVLSDGLTFVKSSISESIGTIYPQTIKIIDRTLYFLSLDGIYSFDGVQLINISLPITNRFNSILQLEGGQNLRSYDSQVQWELGTVSGDFSTTQLSGFLTFADPIVFEDFTDGDLTSNPVWEITTTALSTWSVVGNALRIEGTNSASSGQTSGGFLIGNTFRNGTVSFDLKINSWDAAVISFGVMRSTGGLGFGMTTAWNIEFGETENRIDLQWQLTRLASATVSGLMDVGVTTWHIHIKDVISSGDGTGKIVVFREDIEIMSFEATGIFPIFDYSSIAITADDQNGSYEVELDNIKFSTGQGSWISDDINLNTFTSWDTFSVVDTAGEGTITYSLITDSDSVRDINLPITYISSGILTPSTLPSVQGSTFAIIIATITNGVTAVTSSIDSIILRWFSGDVTFPYVATTFEREYFLAVSTSDPDALDLILVVDRNGRWTEYTSLTAYSMGQINNKPVIGTTEGNILRFQSDTGTYNDREVAIDSFWQSKEFDFGFPVTNKTVNRYYITTERTVNSELTFTYFVDRSSTGVSTTLDLDKNDRIFLEIVKPTDFRFSKGITHSFRISNNISGDYFKLFTITIKPRLETDP